MRVPAWLSKDEAKAWRDLVRVCGDDAKGAAIILEAGACQLARMRDARRRVEAEGEIVLDGRDRPVPHPALVMERAAQGEVRKCVEALVGRAGPAVAAPPAAAASAAGGVSVLDQLAARRVARGQAT